MSRKLNIRPSTGVYATYKHIRYDPWTAIAEFVDNSTQSYYDNQEKLERIKYWKGLKVDIKYEKDEDGSMSLVIRDNAYGMDYRDFQRAIVLDSPPNRPTRSEFGMGLKTAACWFGKMWSVESVELGSGIRFKTIVDVDMLHKYRNEEIEVEETECSKKEHGTTIRIWKLNRKIVGRQVQKTKEQLRGMYRHDLRIGEISISYNDEELQYSDPAILTETLPNGDVKVWKQDVDFVVDNPSGNYRVTGFIALREEGSTSAAGFTLMRRGRVIVGGYENCYRPEEVFEKSNSYVYQRLFGELNLDDWPVTQTKDAFDWYNGLEDDFIDCLVKVCREYARKAKEHRVRKQASAPTVEGMANEFKKAGIIEDPQVEHIELVEDAKLVQSSGAKCESVSSEEASKLALRLVEDSGQLVTFKHKGKDYSFEFVLERGNAEANWLVIENSSSACQKVTLSTAHPFFDPYTSDPEFLEIMEKFAFALALAENDARSTSPDGRIDPSGIRKRMNESLNAVANARCSNG